MPIKVALTHFSDYMQAVGRSPRTISMYVQAITRALQAMELSDGDWTSVTPIDLAEWRRKRAAVAKPATVNLEVDALRQFYRWSVGEGIPERPQALVGSARLRRRPSR